MSGRFERLRGAIIPWIMGSVLLAPVLCLVVAGIMSLNPLLMANADIGQTVHAMAIGMGNSENPFQSIAQGHNNGLRLGCKDGLLYAIAGESYLPVAQYKEIADVFAGSQASRLLHGGMAFIAVPVQCE